MAKKKSLLIIGCGDIGNGLAEIYMARDWRVQGLRRQTSKLADGVEGLAADVCDPSTLSALGPLQADYVVITLTPAGAGAEGYRAVFEDGLNSLLAAISEPPKLVVFVSSTGVYAQAENEWIDEQSVTEPDRYSGQSLLRAEQAIAATGWPYTNIRFGGIYGSGRLQMLKKVISGDCAPAEPRHYTNRIHRDDCVGFIGHLIDRVEAGNDVAPCYLGVDNEPASIQDVQAWLAAELAVEYASKGQPITRTGSKRCSNKRLCDSGYVLKYPTFREGFLPVLAEWRVTEEA
ncbi:Protein YeeZ [Zhongshania aliphaticivorans]|uniref:Protein YeeZ n=1 Tax=Zhongshania aliphaticivorans TaxID=1470434 RepID=A0A5S9QA00_9GAMM|nr:NAD(P)H-binding protein [Zhongshania aliphaticivorans]CAA0102733.1 Protein YeeZ [Zhongshania aliphaticivorans]CAA0113953.1 Protein YeeZ [Zhongshania aliphaticivorans]